MWGAYEEGGPAAAAAAPGNSAQVLRALVGRHADIVLLCFAAPYCPPGHLAYALSPRGARALLQHGLPMEQRIDAALTVLERLSLVRIQHRWMHVSRVRPPCINGKQRLPDATLATALLVVLLYVLAMGVLLLISPRR